MIIRSISSLSLEIRIHQKGSQMDHRYAAGTQPVCRPVYRPATGRATGQLLLRLFEKDEEHNLKINQIIIK